MLLETSKWCLNFAEKNDTAAVCRAPGISRARVPAPQLRSGVLNADLRGGDAANQVFLFGIALGADGEGVEQAERQRELDALVLTIAQGALAENLHADHRFPRRFHLL